MSSTRPGNQERGWNDPPEFLHNNNSANLVTNQRTILNKRVSYSYDNNKPGAEPGTIIGTPPASSNMPPISPLVAPSDGNFEFPTPVNEVKVDIEEIEATINDKCCYLKEKGVSTKVVDDILKRVKIFMGNWEKLSNTVKIKMSELAKCKFLNAGLHQKSQL